MDGDGVGYRTLPGNENPKSAWFARGTGHNEHAVYSERPEDWLKNTARLQRKFDTARRNLFRNLKLIPSKAHASASSPSARRSTRLKRLETTLLKKAWTSAFCAFGRCPSMKKFVNSSKHMNAFTSSNSTATDSSTRFCKPKLPDLATRLVSVAHLDGMPLTAQWLEARLKKEEKEEKNGK